MDPLQTSASNRELVVRKNDPKAMAPVDPADLVQPSPLLQVPAEIRNKIYDGLFSGGLSCDCDDSTEQSTKDPNSLAILGTCRLMRKEALPRAFMTLTFCPNPKHIRSLRRLPRASREAFFSIQHLRLNIICHAKEESCASGIDFARRLDGSGSYAWDRALQGLAGGLGLLNLKTLTANFECLEWGLCRAGIWKGGSSYPFGLSLGALQSCSKFTFSGTFHDERSLARDLENHCRMETTDDGNDGMTITIENPKAKEKWDENRAEQEKRLKKG